MTIALDHAKTILEIVQGSFADRFKMIIFTGLQHEMFYPFKEFIIKETTVPAVEVPFFYGTNMPKIREIFHPESAAGKMMRDVYADFMKG